MRLIRGVEVRNGELTSSHRASFMLLPKPGRILMHEPKMLALRYSPFVWRLLFVWLFARHSMLFSRDRRQSARRAETVFDARFN